MTSNAFGLIYTGENNPRLRDLTLSRAVAAVPFGGRYRCIDFILSDLVNTGVTCVGLIAQKNYHSLMDHLGAGKEWDLHRKREGLFILPPFMTKENTGLYRGTIDALRSCLGYVRRCTQQYVILTGSHTIFNTTFDGMFEQHVRSGADITVLYNEETRFDPEEQSDDLRLLLEADGRVSAMELNPYRPRSELRSCDVMIMDKLLLEYLVEEAYSRGEYDFIRDVLLKKCGTLKIFGCRYDGYVARLDSVSSLSSGTTWPCSTRRCARTCSTRRTRSTPRSRTRSARATARRRRCATRCWPTGATSTARWRTACCSAG